MSKKNQWDRLSYGYWSVDVGMEDYIILARGT